MSNHAIRSTEESDGATARYWWHCYLARDLSKAEPARITDIVTSDRVLLSFVQGMTAATRIVLVTASDIASVMRLPASIGRRTAPQES